METLTTLGVPRTVAATMIVESSTTNDDALKTVMTANKTKIDESI
jgi:hypothetical protein